MLIEGCLFGNPGCERPLLDQWPILVVMEIPGAVWEWPGVS